VSPDVGLRWLLLCRSVTAKVAEDTTASAAVAANPGEVTAPPGRTMIA